MRGSLRRALLVPWLLAGCAGADPGPPGERLADYRPPARLAGGPDAAPVIHNFGPRERLIVRSAPAASMQLLFLEGRAAAPLPGGRAAWPDRDGARVVIFDGRGAVAEVLEGAPPRGLPLSAPVFAATPGPEVWAVEGSTALRFADGRPTGWLRAALPAPPSSGRDGLVPAARTILEFHLAPVRPEDPLIWILNARGEVAHTLGRVEVPENALLGEIANSGWVVTDERGRIYFAHALEPELRRYDVRRAARWFGLRPRPAGRDPAGTLRWVSVRPLTAPPPPPRLAAPGGVLDPVFTPVHFGVALGPDGRIYVLGAAGPTGTPDHLYVFEDDGTLLRAGKVPRDHALFADWDGRVYALPRDEALARTGKPQRTPFPAFALPALRGGDTIRLEDYRGRIVVANFWASWCGPCRQEMPALDAYAREVDSTRIAILGLNDDVDPDDARAFVSELGIQYPSAEGRGRLRERYGYRGLPYTVILDGDLRVIEAIYGFGTSVDPLRETVARELVRQPAPSHGGSQHRPAVGPQDGGP